ncbi:MAG: cell wall-binding protein [Hungatella sp.]|jgi:glucan-binding YG repeat protein|nr:cell wall-binding protein [Hungatella sp.]
MKKQTKLIMALSTSAMLSAIAALTSFAASGWIEENCGWAYYEENGERVTEDWVKSGNDWFWMDSSGQMAAEQLLEIDNNYYYLQQNGAMAHDQWVALDNKNADQEGEPEQYWYYFQDNGKACKRPDNASSGSIKTKEIDGKKYTFDAEGRMLYGWVSDGERQTGEDAWKDCDYYFGPEGDGAMRRGWDRIRVEADPEDEMMPGDGLWDDEQQERWFYFSSSGKKTRGKPDRLVQKTIDGQKYGFDECGRMISSWYADPDLITTDIYDKNVSAEENLTARQGGSLYTKEFMYFGSPESGARYSKGWFRATPSRYLMESKHLDNETYSYYADGDGNLYANEIRTIDGERYGFDNYGRLISGLVCLEMEDKGTSSRIINTWYQDKEGREFSDEEKFEELLDYERRVGGYLRESFADEIYNHKRRFYFFSGPNSSALTGKQIVKLGDQSFEFMFEDSGYLKGSGVNGKKDGRLYRAGWQLKPEEGQKYAIIRQETVSEENPHTNVLFKYKKLDKMEVEDFIAEVCNSGIYNEKKEETVWTVRYDPPGVKYYLIGSNGDIVKNKKNAVDVDGYEFRVNSEKIQSITVEE